MARCVLLWTLVALLTVPRHAAAGARPESIRVAVPDFATAVAAPASPQRGQVFPGLMARIEAAHRFLRHHRDGLPFTRDPRALSPFQEVIRLEADAQALGYLNLYRLTGEAVCLREAEDRLDYILALGDSALGDRSLEGQIGYSFLCAYELDPRPEYLAAGLRIARRCLDYTDNVLNWGYAAALCWGKAWRLTGEPRFLSEARRVTRRTADRQFPDGAFPHRGNLVYGENTHYTAWLVFEMLLHRLDDPDDPDMDYGILRATRFLARRVNPDGSVNYEDAAGSYWSDPNNADPRGWTNELAMMAYDLLAVGRRAEARALLGFLAERQTGGRDAGGFPDKWGYPDPGNAWAAGDPSVLRTSLVFWVLTALALEVDVPANGVARPCAITSRDCSAAFREFGLCDSGYAGTNTCIAGVFTGCMNEDSIRYRRDAACEVRWTCTYHPERDQSDLAFCWGSGAIKCIGPVCSDPCLETTPENLNCTHEWLRRNACDPPSDTTRARRASAGATDAAEAEGPESGALRVEGAIPNPTHGDVALAFRLPAAGTVRLELFDTAGRRIARREWSGLGPGRHVVPVPLEDRLAPGIYLVRLRQGDRAAATRVIVTR